MFRHYKHLAYFSNGVLFVMTLFSVYAYRERMLFVDPAWVSFNIINDGTFSFAEYRYGAFISQLFPLVASSLGLSLKAVLMLYSFGFYAFYLGASLLLTFRMKQYGTSILLVLYFTVFVSDGYFWPNNEVHQGVVWMLLFVGAFLSVQKNAWTTHLVLVLLLALAICSHLIVSIPLLFLWLYIRTDRSFPPSMSKMHLVYSVLMVLFLFIRYKLSSTGWYDGSKLEGVKQVTLSGLFNAFSSGQARSFITLVGNVHWVALLITVSSIVLLLAERRYRQLIIMIGASAGCFAVVCLVYPDAFGRNLRFYMESEWQALAILIATPLVTFYSSANKYRKVVFYGFASVLVIKSAYIFNSYSFFHQRYERLAGLTNTLRGNDIYKALIVAETSNAEDKFIMKWGLPVESMLYSGLERFDTAVTFKVVAADLGLHQRSPVLHSCFDTLGYENLNLRYFPIDTAGEYTIINNLDSLLELQ